MFANKKLLILLVTIIGMQAEAEFIKNGATVDVSWIQGKVYEEAMALTKTTKRDLIVYSYVDRNFIAGFGKQGEVAMTTPELVANAWDNATARMTRFWSTEIPVSGRSTEGGAMAPNGLYVATEPVISRTYGNVALRMVIPAGTRFIDGRYRTAPVLGQNLQEALKQRGCENPLKVDSKNRVFAVRNLIKADSKQQACRQALIEIAEATKSKSILYVFRDEPIPFCKKTHEWNSAFVLIDDTAVKKDSFQPIVIGQSDNNDGLESEREVLNGIYASTKLALPFPKSQVASVATAEKYMSDNFMACNPQINEK